MRFTDRLRDMLADFAGIRMEVNAELERDAEDADARRHYARKVDFWHDVQCRADRVDTWRNLRRRHRAAAPLMPPIHVDEPVRLPNPIIIFMLIMLAFFAISLVMPLVLPKAHAEEAGTRHDPARAAWFKSLMQPGTNTSCCDISDCRKTRAEWRGTGWVAEMLMPDGTRIWTPIPPSKVLLKPHSIDGEAYLCQSAGNVAGPAYYNGIGMVGRTASDPIIYCFVPPDMGS